MATFRLNWTDEVWYTMLVEADSEEEALDLLWSGEAGYGTLIGSEMQDSVTVEEVE